jgi:hypothetical protein
LVSNSTLKRQLLLDKINNKTNLSQIPTNNKTDNLFINSNNNNNYKTTSNSRNVDIHEETLVVKPKQLKHTQSESFQIDCIYYGLDYMNTKLVWTRNNLSFHSDVNNNHHNYKNKKHINEQRYYILFYRQNFSCISLLKFRHALLNDSGIYQCKAIKSNSHLVNEFRSYSLNATSRLIVTSKI